MTAPRMRCLHFGAFREALPAVYIPLPEPTGTEVLIEVLAAGVCHSVLHVQDGDLRKVQGTSGPDLKVHPILYKSKRMYRMGYTMPAKAPPVGDVLATRLQALGKRIRAHRERQKVSATVAAEAAGMSRVTLHRIEGGEPSVTMGAYLSAIDAVGLQLELRDPQARPATADVASLPERIRLADFAQLKGLAWQLHEVDELSPADALNLYERNWRHIDQARMEPAERALLQALVDRLGGGRLLV